MNAVASSASELLMVESPPDFLLTIDCMLVVFNFLPGHESRATSRSLKIALDASRPIVVLGPPALPARLWFRETVGMTRTGYGLWSPTHKVVTIMTCKRKGTRATCARAALSAAGEPACRWDQTTTTGTLAFGSGCPAPSEPGFFVDLATSNRCWLAALRLLRASDNGTLIDSSSAGQPPCTLHFRFAGGRERKLKVVSAELVQCLEQISATTVS